MSSRLGLYIHSRKHIFAISFSRLSDALGGGAVYFALPLFIAGINPTSIPNAFLSGVIIAIWGIVATIVQPVIGLAIDRTGRAKLLLFLGLLATSMVLYTYTRVEDLLALLSVRVALGFTEAVVMVSSIVILASVSERRKRGENFGIFYTVTDIGFALSPVLAGILLEYYGFSEVFIAGAALTLMSAALVLRLVPEVEISSLNDGKREKPSREILMISTTLFFTICALSAYVPLEESFLSYMSLTPLTFGITYSAYIITRTFFNAPAGRLSDRMGRKRIFVAGTVILGISTIAVPLCQNFLQFLILRVFQGVVVAFIYSPATALVADKSEHNLGLGMSVTNSALTLGLALGPIFAGFLGGYIGFFAPFYFFGLSIVLSGFLSAIKVSEEFKFEIE
jgi:MFS family permease